MKNEWIRSRQESGIVKYKLNEWARNIFNHEEAIPVIKDYELVIRPKEKRILNVAYRQRLFEKFKESNKFAEMLREVEVSNSTVSFKWN